MQVLQRRGLHPAKGLWKAPTENSRAVFRLRRQGQQWALSRGSFMNVSVEKTVRVEMAPVACQKRGCRRCRARRCHARRCLPFTSLCRTTEGNTHLIVGTTFQTFLSEQLEEKLTSLPGQSFAALLLASCRPECWSSFQVWSTVPMRRWLHSRLTAFHAAESALGTCLGWQSCTL